MDSGFLKYGDAEVHFVRFGEGARLLIALHGFADEGGAIFLKLEESLKKRYTVYCIDLPFHGMTKWDKEEFDRKDVSAIFKTILQKEKKERFELMGFSLGGRIVQKMLAKWMSQVDKIYLIAPDGLKDNGLLQYRLMPRWLKSFLKWLLRKPGWFINMAKQFHRWGLISRFSHNFVCFHFQTKEKRERLFFIWYSLEHFIIDTNEVKSLLKKHPIPVDMYFGNRDEIIPVSTSASLREGMPNVRIFELEEGHLLVNKKLDEWLKKYLV